MLTTIVAFLVALGVLIAVHEYGHYRMAVACGVKVLRFSVGFGRAVFTYRPRKQKRGQDTEFVIGAFPLGGYVKMLDEREGFVNPEERHLAFNTQPLGARALIVAAGPVANLLLAVVLYSAVNWWGVEEPKAIISSPVAGSLADHAGLHAGDHVTRGGFDGDDLQRIRSFEDLRWLLTRGALDGRDVRLEVEGSSRQPLLELSGMRVREADAQLFRTIGIVSPWTPPVIGEVMDKGAGRRAGLREGDIVLAIGSTQVLDGPQLRDRIRSAVNAGQGVRETWRIRRGGSVMELPVQPDAVREGDKTVGRIGAFVGAPPQFTTVRYGAVEGFEKGAQRTWEISVLTLRMMGRMVIGEASIKNLSGPLTIADYAGKSANLGLTQYLVFLALISVSLGVLNLLPLPVLDGGHLMYYLWEAVTGRSISEAWMERLQRGGVAVLLLMMSIALFNDVTRLFG
ncbi:MAG TPA: RIP metalloprotease RseP [Ramlibacter sp.]|jgi:regulator of sigma E protease